MISLVDLITMYVIFLFVGVGMTIIMLHYITLIKKLFEVLE